VVAAPTESPGRAGGDPASPALGVAPPLTPPARSARSRTPAGSGRILGQGMWIGTLGVAALLCLLAFYTRGGLNLETLTNVELGVTLAAAVVLAAGILVIRPPVRAWGAWPAGLLLAFALLSGVSLVWSVQPDGSWRDAGRLLCYATFFAAVVVLVRVIPRRWPSLIGGITLASVVICGYALLTKSLPNHFEQANLFARIYEPYGYWNALGLTAAMGAIGCMWLGARRAGNQVLNALAYPAMGVLLLTLLLAYSRGALVALLVALALWFCLVPLRLRGAAVLVSGAVAAGAIAAWDFSNHSLSSEKVPLAEATSAGHELGALVIAMVVLLAALGAGVTFATARSAPSALVRRRAGLAIAGALAALVLAFAGALAVSHRGFTGTISHALHSLTDTHAKVPNTPGRLTAIASVRAQYWDEALKVFKAHPMLGSGAAGYEVARLRYRTGPLPVKHAHGFIVQTMADLGVVGLLAALALLGTWMSAAGRPTHPFNRRWRSWRELRAGARPAWEPLPSGALRRYGPERIGMLSMLCMVVLFGIHSAIDWTWYIPGIALAALACAGWLAGRGPLLNTAGAAGAGAGANGPPSFSRAGLREAIGRPSAVRIAAACAIVAGALLIAWTQWQPQRSEEARETALGELARNPPGATAAAQAAVSRDPLSAEALFALADVQAATGHRAAARATLQKAVRLQPSNPRTWVALGMFDLGEQPEAALQELRAGIYLDPASISPEALAAGHPEAIATYNAYVQALRAVTQKQSASVKRPPAVRAKAKAAVKAKRKAALRSAPASRARARAAARRARRAARRAARIQRRQSAR
jgi:O-antigen ligase/tetratricopeptide (TPR) repeat protein